MDAEQQRIEEDLKGQISGTIRCDDFTVRLYASDASIFEIAPLGVVCPRSTDDVVATVNYAAENEISLHARGSGSGLTGGALGKGLIVDFSRYMRRAVRIGHRRATVQSGMVLSQLNHQLAEVGRVFGPDPANSEVTTLGSAVAVDASGSRFNCFGTTRDHLEEVQLVLASGEVVRLGNHQLPQAGDTSVQSSLINGVDEIISSHENSVEEHSPQSLVNCSGYRLDDVRSGGNINLARLLAGSEGTLGLITEVTLKTAMLPTYVNSVILFFESLDKAAHAVQEILPLLPSACDMMDRRHLSLARESDVRFELLIPQVIEAALLVEFTGDTEDQVDHLLNSCTRAVEQAKLVSGYHVALDRFDHDMLWELARHYVPTLYRLTGSTRPIPFVEDLAVPPERLPDFVQQLQKLLKLKQITASLFGHASHGQLHLRPFLDLANPQDVARIYSLADALYDEVWKHGGTISGEHGDGLSRTPYVRKQYGPLHDAFVEIKRLFDPKNMLNPGKIVQTSETDSRKQIRRVGNLDSGGERGASDSTGLEKVAPPTVSLQLEWESGEMAHTARICNGCAACRTQSEEVRMCPIFHFAPREEASPRAKANLARGLLTGSLPSTAMLEEACKQISDLCVHCHMCRLECPAHVDIPKLMMETKGSYVATNNQHLFEWLLTRVDRLCSLGSRFSRLTNWAIGNRVARWFMEKSLGIAQGRKLPRFSSQAFLTRSASRRLNRPQRSPGEKVLYFVDTFANYCDTQLAEAFVSVLEHNGISVYVPDRQLHAAMPQISRGVLEPARRIAEENVALLAEGVRLGYKIVATEPSAVLALTHEYLHLLPDDPDVELVSQNTLEACHYLWKCHQRGMLELGFSPLPTSIGYHVPCHLRALEVGNPAENLLQLIPGLHIERLEKGCSGIAGMYGFHHRTYRNSLRAGLPLLSTIRTSSFEASTTECSTCKIQMEQGTTKPTIHPIKIMALAYGLMPELRNVLNSTSEDLVVT